MRSKRTAAEVSACRRCGSTALHHMAYGLPSIDMRDEAARQPNLRLGGCCIGPESWSSECLTCGEREYVDGDSSERRTAVRPQAAGLVTRYAELAREKVDMATAPAISYAGLWLLLAHLAPVATGNHRDALAEALGVSGAEAAALAEELLTAPHATLVTALGAWSRVALTATLAVPIEAMPDQAGLDRWADERTRGLITRFPLDLKPATLLLFATALVLEPRWAEELWTDDDGMLVLDDGLQALVDTRAAGLVAVAKPFSGDGVDVVSVIAAEEVSPHDVWRAVDEVIDRLNQGGLWHGEHPGWGLTDGHAWTVREVTQSFRTWDSPPEDGVLWRSRLPHWKQDAISRLNTAPGLAEVVASLRERVPELAGGPFECTQAATAAYDEEGFTAAAVTAMEVEMLGVPQYVERTVRRVEVTFDRPHAVTAIARGGPWEGVPVFNAWVTPS